MRAQQGASTQEEGKAKDGALGKREQREAAGQGTGKLNYKPGVHGPGNKAPCSALMALRK